MATDMTEKNSPVLASDDPPYEPHELNTLEVIPDFPPYPPYAKERAPPSVAETIIAGRDLRVQHKSIPRKPVKPPPKPAKPKGPKATDIKLSKRAARAHARCLRRQSVLTDRLELISKPPPRTILYLWRQYANSLPAETIARLQAMLDADEPHKPDQAYEYFVNLRKTRKKNSVLRDPKQFKRGGTELYGVKKCIWARNATVAFAIGIHQRLSRSGVYSLTDGMRRLSNVIFKEICGFMKTRITSCKCNHLKAKIMMEISDKVAVWIHEIMTESDDRMLMIDFDEDKEVTQSIEEGLKEGGAPSDSDNSGSDITTSKKSTTTPSGISPPTSKTSKIVIPKQ